MKALPTLFAIASNIRQASLTNSILRTAHQYRHLTLLQLAECNLFVRRCVDERLHHDTFLVAFVAAVLDIECWLTHNMSIVEFYLPEQLIAVIANILQMHGYISPVSAV